ncbi:MAG: type VI secretion system tube protein Hcp [Armatimonas sp.]
MKALTLTLALLSLVATTLPARAQNPTKQPQALRILRMNAPGATMAIEGIADGAPLSINTLSVGVRNANTIGSLASGAGAGKATFNDITIVRSPDEASPDLFVAVAMGRAIPRVTLKSGGFTITLSNVLITGHQISTDATATPTETITIVAAQIVVTSPRGKSAGWDVKTNKKV